MEPEAILDTHPPSVWLTTAQRSVGALCLMVMLATPSTRVSVKDSIRSHMEAGPLGGTQ